MINSKIIILMSVITLLTGCASSSSLEKQANLNAKAGSYYKSVGQDGAAKEEYKSSAKNHEDANEVFPILVELFNLFSSK